MAGEKQDRLSLVSQPLPSVLLRLCNSCKVEGRGWRTRLG